MKRTLSGLLSLLIVLTLFTPFSIVFAEEDAATSGIVYYVDAEDGDDNNPGTSPEQAWKSLTKVTATTFQPGDQILLENGSGQKALGWKVRLLKLTNMGARLSLLLMEWVWTGDSIILAPYICGIKNTGRYETSKLPTMMILIQTLYCRDHKAITPIPIRTRHEMESY